MKASSHIIREIHLDRMFIKVKLLDLFKKYVATWKFSDNISDMLAVAFILSTAGYSFTSFFASIASYFMKMIFNKAFSKTSKNIGTCYMDQKLIHFLYDIPLIIDYVVDLNNNITIEIIHRLATNMTIRAFVV
ncbi:hypothetical protein ACJX0J_009168, partial [Zea mays]